MVIEVHVMRDPYYNYVVSAMMQQLMDNAKDMSVEDIKEQKCKIFLIIHQLV